MHLCSIGGSMLAWEVDLYLVLNSGPATSRMWSENTSMVPRELFLLHSLLFSYSLHQCSTES